MAGTPKFCSLVTPSDMGAARRVEPAILAELQRHGYSEQAIFAIRLSMEEALANAVNHGNRRDCTRSLKIEYCVDEERAVFRVADEGCGFDRKQVVDPTTPENLERPCGRGIMLMEAYMNSVCWNDRGNQVEMVKLRD